ncbi:MAG: class I SAM-dependent methyltransferase [Thermodesulfobacteriota bacterium]
MPTLEDVKEFWENHPLCAYEIPYAPGSVAFFRAHDRLKRESTDRFNLDKWEFDLHKGDRVLDVGCGPGWLVQEYRRGGANILGVDLSWRALSLAWKRLAYQKLEGSFVQCNAEDLPFKDDLFDFISCSGVLHHTPDTLGGIREIYRVLKPGKKAVVSLYYRSFVFHPVLWPLCKMIIRRLFLGTSFRNESKRVEDAEDFIRLYDGDGNPLGKAYSLQEARKMFSCFSKVKYEVHYFPKRFIDPFIKIENTQILRILDRCLGTMLFAIAEK